LAVRLVMATASCYRSRGHEFDS